MNTKLHSTKTITPLTGSVRVLIAGLVLAVTSAAFARDVAERVAAPPAAQPTGSRIEIRTPDDALRTGFDYLLKQQQGDGGWGQGGGWRQNEKGGGRVEGLNVEDRADLGNTCVTLVAMLRAEDARLKGEYRDAVRKAFDFICKQVEKSDADSLYATSIRDTQLQVKIGTYVDTFLAGWALSELKGRLHDEALEKRRAAALDKVVAKIERNQRKDGSFTENKGWAAVLSQGLCSKALNSAARSGAKVSNQVLATDNLQNTAGLDRVKGDFSAPVAATEPSTAGISLYREAAKLGGLREKTLSNVARKAEAEKKIADPAAPAAEKDRARADLRQFADDEKASDVAQRAVAAKLGDGAFVAGFGNNGGEEFLSYMNLGESLRERGGKEWDAWKTKMHATLCAAQNGDGSWAGQHCITGRTFCTSTALLTLLIDRVPAGAALGAVKDVKATPTAAAK